MKLYQIDLKTGRLDSIEVTSEGNHYVPKDLDSGARKIYKGQVDGDTGYYTTIRGAVEATARQIQADLEWTLGRIEMLESRYREAIRTLSVVHQHYTPDQTLAIVAGWKDALKRDPAVRQNSPSEMLVHLRTAATPVCDALDQLFSEFRTSGGSELTTKIDYFPAASRATITVKGVKKKHDYMLLTYSHSEREWSVSSNGRQGSYQETCSADNVYQAIGQAIKIL
jgi:hypothetical protein